MKNVKVMIRSKWKEGFEFVWKKIGEQGRKKVFSRQFMDALVEGDQRGAERMRVYTRLVKHYHDSLLGK